MPAPKYNYTPETDAIIREAYQGPMRGLKCVRIASRKLGWSPGIIKYRAKILGLTRTKELPWSEEELKILDRNVHLHPRRIHLRLRVAGFLRTESAIVSKRNLLKLYPTRGGYSAQSLGGLFGIDSHRVAAWIAQGWLRAVRRGGDSARDEWFIAEKDVFEFALQHPNEYDLAKVSKVWFLDLVTQGSMVWTGKYEGKRG